MDQTKLNKIIADKNEQRERTTLQVAADIIESIAAEQRKIVLCNESIARHRKALQELQVEQLAATEILG